MKTLNAFGILVQTYFIVLAVNIVSLFLIVLPVTTMSRYVDFFAVIVIGLITSFLVPGVIAAVIFLPILMIDKSIRDFDIKGLIKRYLPLVILPYAIIMLVFGNWTIIIGDGLYFCLYMYVEVIICIYVFCRTIVKNKA